MSKRLLLKIKENREDRYLKKSKRIEINEKRKLLSEKKSYLSPEIIGSYGIDYQLKKFAGLDTNIILNKCRIEHGLGIRRAVCQCEVGHHISHILTFSPFREEVIKELTDIFPIAIGPYIAYAEDYRSSEYIEKIKKKSGRILLVMPCHSIQGITLDYNIKQFIREIENKKKQFDKVIVCMYFEDMRKGMWKPYSEMGYNIVSAGNTGNPFFLSRLKYIFRLSDAVIANDFTTGIAYALYMNCPICLVHQKIIHNVTCHNNAFELDLGMEKQTEQIFDLFENCRFIITNEQREFGNYLFGLKNVKSKSEMKEILIPLSRKMIGDDLYEKKNTNIDYFGHRSNLSNTAPEKR